MELQFPSHSKSPLVELLERLKAEIKKKELECQIAAEKLQKLLMGK